MKILENDLLIHYDGKEEKLVVYRLMEGNVPSKVLLTEYPLSKLKSIGVARASCLLGEDILIFLSSTRKVLLSDKGSKIRSTSERRKRKTNKRGK